MSESRTAITGVMFDPLTGEISVERACANLLRKGQAVTSTAVAAHTGLGRTTLYRDAMLRSVIEENRHRAAASGTLTNLTDEIATVPRRNRHPRHERAAPRRTTPETDLQKWLDP